MIDLTNAKFGDKYKTRNGKIAILTKGHRNARLGIWFQGCIGSIDCELADNNYDEHCWYKDGTAQEGFEWYDLIEKIE